VVRSGGLLLVCVFVLLACALGGCAGSKTDLGSPANAWAPAPGATAADSAEQVRVVQAIRAMDNLRTDRCTERSVSDTAVLDSAGAVAAGLGASGAGGGAARGGAAGAAGAGAARAGAAGAAAHDSIPAQERFPRHERWTIDRCGKRVSYLVEFSREDSGGVAITVRFE
jgi:hypothetical protein